MPMESRANNCVAGAESAIEAPPQAAAATLAQAATGHALERVVYVVSQFPSWSETFIVREIQALIEAGVDVRIVSLKPSAETMVQADAAALLDRVHQPPSLPATFGGALLALLRQPAQVIGVCTTIVADTWRTPGVLVRSLGTLCRGLCHLPRLRAFDPQFIHAHWSTYPTTAAWALSRLMQRPFGFTCHAHDVFRNQQMLPRKIREAAVPVTISRHNVDFLNRHVSSEASRRLKVIHCGVDLRQIAWTPDNRVGDRIVGVGRLSPEKGFHTLVEALATLRDGGTPFTCTVIGEGPARAELEAQIERLDLGSQVALAGAQPQEYVRAQLASATVFTLPCQVAANGSRDGIPVALMEAMASGCPVVSCPVSGVPELIGDDVHGLLAREGDAASLAHALKRLLEDSSLRQRLARAARQRIEVEFDARTEALKLHALMREATHAA